MNKELEENIKTIKNIIYDSKGKKVDYIDIDNFILDEDCCENFIRAIETVLNYIDNSISKEAIKEKIEELKNRKMDIVTSPIYSRDEKLSILKRNQIKREALQELLEEK